jgi:heptosyltransferase-2
MRVAILKPDHLGDLVLAAPAIAALQRRFDDLTLLCHPGSEGLAHHLFPGLPLQPILFPHLDRNCRTPMHARPLLSMRDEFDLFICLRWDACIRRHLNEAAVTYQACDLDDLDVHVTLEHRQAVEPWTGPYDLLASFRYPAGSRELRRPVERIGLCIAAGFSHNAWPLNHWLELAERLMGRGMEIVWIGGPSETNRLRALVEADAPSGNRPQILVGNENFGRFLQKLAKSVDLVIATDSGTAHLASLVRPVLSLFGGSPWRRFAPLGPCNAIVTRQLPCSPCPQFDRNLVNTCVSRECLVGLTPAQVESCLDDFLARKSGHRPRRVGEAWLARAPWEPVKSRLEPVRAGTRE